VTRRAARPSAGYGKPTHAFELMKITGFHLNLGHRLWLVCALGCFGNIALEAQELIANPSAAAYAVIDHQSGHVLGSFNGKKKLPVASLTKIAAACVALDWAHAAKRDLDQFIAVSPSAAALGTTGQGITWAAGDSASLRDFLYAALLQSDNVAVQTIAEYVGRLVEQPSGSEDPAIPFIAQMNALARKLDMNDTRFLNPHGLEGFERKLPYSTAEDMARLTAYAMSNAGFRFIVSQKERRVAVRRQDSSKFDYMLRNTNDALGESSIDGVKTGTTKQAGQCLAISAARPPEVRQEGETFFPIPRRLEVVVLGSQNRFEEAKQLLQAGWSQHQRWVAAGRPIDPKEKTGIKTALGF